MEQIEHTYEIEQIEKWKTAVETEANWSPIGTVAHPLLLRDDDDEWRLNQAQATYDLDKVTSVFDAGSTGQGL